jgi:hypothetical protein
MGIQKNESRIMLSEIHGAYFLERSLIISKEAEKSSSFSSRINFLQATCLSLKIRKQSTSSNANEII